MNEITHMGYEGKKLYVKWKYPIMWAGDLPVYILTYTFPSEEAIKKFYEGMMKK